MPTSFSHHQKFVVVDTRIGFVGGLDLTVGRYESRARGKGERGEEERRDKDTNIYEGGTRLTTR